MKMLRLLIVAALCGVWLIDGVGLSTRYLKGTYSVVREDKKHLSPAWGCNWYMLGVPKNMYRYGPEASPTIMLVKELFNYYADERILRPTNSPSKIAYYFTPSLIGAIINEIENESLSGKEEKKEERSLADRIETILNENLKNAAQWQEVLKKQTQKNIDELKKYYKNVQNKIDNAQKNLSKIKPPTGEEVYDLTIQNEYKKKKDKTEKGIQANKRKLLELLMQIDAPKAFGQLIADSIQEIKKGDYQEHAIHWILLSFLWAKAESKQAILEYFEAFNPAIATISDPKDWVKSEYGAQDYSELKSLFIAQPEEMIAKKEEAFFCSCTDSSYFTLSPENEPYKPLDYMAGVQVKKNDQIYEFSDCGETSTREFISTMLYDAKAKRFDVSRLKGSSFKPAQSVFDYYQTYSTRDALSTRQAHDAWAQIISDLPGVSYKKDHVCEIMGGLPSVLKLLNHLLFGNNPEFDQKANKQKVQYLFDSFSSKESPIEWSELEKKDIDNVTVDIVIQFRIANLFYDWGFKTGHYYLRGMHENTFQNSLQVYNHFKNSMSDVFSFNIIMWLVAYNEGIPVLSEVMDSVAQQYVPAKSNQFFYMQNFDNARYINNFLWSMCSSGYFTLSLELVGNLIRKEANYLGYLKELFRCKNHQLNINPFLIKEIKKVSLGERIQLLRELGLHHTQHHNYLGLLFTLKEIKENFDKIDKEKYPFVVDDLLALKKYSDSPEELESYLQNKKTTKSDSDNDK